MYTQCQAFSLVVRIGSPLLTRKGVLLPSLGQRGETHSLGGGGGGTQFRQWDGHSGYLGILYNPCTVQSIRAPVQPDRSYTTVLTTYGSLLADNSAEIDRNREKPQGPPPPAPRVPTPEVALSFYTGSYEMIQKITAPR
jgi:hypothetical protein